ncbi:unnamed protein product [Leptidea sinapis]|uniref:CCDC66 domain-containing protein n=1 Tax=Leptidea sinapis TaxID=189913 RepID=A0A5E4QFW7_9NEOP|nr:unnamed protein product [Leptidea sinapis]
MSQLYLPWGVSDRQSNRLQNRNQFASTLELHKAYYPETDIQRQRSPSLPPIHHLEVNKTAADDRKTRGVVNRNIPSAQRFSFYDEDAEGDTSGYGSETINHNTKAMSDRLPAANNKYSNNAVVAWQHNGKEIPQKAQNDRTGMTETWSARSSGAEEGRPRWGDRGVATGRLWEPTAPNARLPQVPNQNKSTPAWVERGLNMIENTSDMLVIDQGSSSNSRLEFDKSSCNGSDEGRTYLRGQNVPLEPEIKAQRETKRIKALELQSAILSQLEEREKQKQDEKERRLREERLEELRIQRQQDEDRMKVEEEKRRNDERLKNEQKKIDALKKALEDAEKKARLEKEKRFKCHKQAVCGSVFSENNNIEKINEKQCESVQCSPKKIASPTKSSRTYDVHSAYSQKKDNISQPTSPLNSPRSIGNGNLNLYIHTVPPLKLADNQFNILPIGIANPSENNCQPNSIQLAVLVPQNFNNSYYSLSLHSSTPEDGSNLGKVLTPSKYRSMKTKDVSTQTDDQLCKDRINVDGTDRCGDNVYVNIDEDAPQETNNTKKDRRLRYDNKFRKEIENRPKWGANRPQAQYKKQSEKDPFYTQKRKLRQKCKPTVREYLSQSSEDSRSPSPLASTDKNSENWLKPRYSLSQSYWNAKNNSRDISIANDECENETKYSSDFISLSQISNKDDTKGTKMSPSKRLTLSQKFINDKYGSRRLWPEEAIGKITKYNTDIDLPKRIF